MDEVASPLEAINRLARADYDAVFLDGNRMDGEVGITRLLQSEHILDGLPDGVALVDADINVTWVNAQLRKWCPDGDPLGKHFYATLGSAHIVGPEFCPFHSALATASPTSSTLATEDNRFFQIHVSPLTNAATESAALVATISEITSEVQQQQKLAAIHQAGRQLTDLKPDEIFAMDTQARIDLLKDNIRFYTADLLDVSVMEIRLLEADGNLRPLLSVGIRDEAADRPLKAQMQGNGVTGYVASTGRSYLCTDASQDPLYLEAFDGGASSLTVPLKLHEEVIGTINVESNKVAAFDNDDMQFLEIFSRDVAAALNTLELLVAQQNNAAQQSCEAIHSAVALPVDHILNDAVNVIEKHIGQDPQVVERLQRILQNARNIRRVIQQIGQRLAPVEALPAGCSEELHAKLRGKRILVVDSEMQTINDAHMLLECFGCFVEAAHTGDEAVGMFRNSRLDSAYDVVISAVNLPDYSGYQLMLRLQKFTDHVPMALMQGFGYDPGHSIVKAREAGLPAKAVMYKPLKQAQLLNVVELILDQHATETV